MYPTVDRDQRANHYAKPSTNAEQHLGWVALAVQSAGDRRSLAEAEAGRGRSEYTRAGFVALWDVNCVI